MGGRFWCYVAVEFNIMGTVKDKFQTLYVMGFKKSLSCLIISLGLIADNPHYYLRILTLISGINWILPVR